MADQFFIGQRVVAARDIWQEATEDLPFSRYAKRGDVLVVRKFGTHFPVYVSHENRTDNSFGVREDEITTKGTVTQ